MTEQIESSKLELNLLTSNSNRSANKFNLLTLPQHGFSRESQLLSFLPFSSSTLWKWSREGKFVPHVKLSPTMTVWDNAKVHIWLEKVAEGKGRLLAEAVAKLATCQMRFKREGEWAETN